MPYQLSAEKKQQRATRVKAVAREMREVYLQQFIGKTLRVLWEHQDKGGLWCGHAPYHFIVKIADAGCRKNTYGDVLITAVQGESLIGQLAQSAEGQGGA